MKLRDYIEAGAEMSGSLTTLASIIGVTQPRLSRMKAGKEHMPLMVAVKLADTLDCDRLSVIISAEIAAAKEQSEQDYWCSIEESLSSEEMRYTPKAHEFHPKNQMQHRSFTE